MLKIDIDNIRKNLKHKDHLKIKDKTGYSLSYISEVVNGKKNNDEILEAAAKIAAKNIKRRERIANILPQQTKNIPHE